MVLDGSNREWHPDQNSPRPRNGYLPTTKHTYFERSVSDRLHTLHHNEWSDRQRHQNNKQLPRSANTNQQHPARATVARRLPHRNRQSAELLFKRSDNIV